MEGDLRVLYAAKASNATGYTSYTFEVEPGESHFLATAQAEEGYAVYVDTVYGPDGGLLFYAQDYWDSPRSRTNAIYASPAATFGLPVLPTDDALQPGRYEVIVGLVNADSQYESKVRSEFSVTLKADDQLDQGHLHINLVYAGGTDQDEALMAGMETVLSKWRELYEQTGITLEFETSTWGDGELEAPSIGSAEAYRQISEASGFRSVNVVIVPEIALWDDLYGIAGHIPGPLVSAPNAAVLVSASLALGTNGVFDAGEKRLFAETLAHETGHYLGLYHPVEIGWNMWDALEDTQECTSEESCIDGMKDNLMFAFPYCTSSGCVPQVILTNDQSDAMNLYVGVE